MMTTIVTQNPEEKTVGTVDQTADPMALTQYDIIKQAWAAYKRAHAKCMAIEVQADKNGQDEDEVWDGSDGQYADPAEGGFGLWCYQVMGREAMCLNQIIAYRLRVLFGDAIEVAECDSDKEKRVVPAFQFKMRSKTFGEVIEWSRRNHWKPVITWHFQSYEDAPKFYIGTDNWYIAKAFNEEFFTNPVSNVEEMNEFDLKAMNY